MFVLFQVESKNEEQAYYKFFEDYGTHFFTEMNFGSKFIYQHKMSSDEYKKQSGKQFSITAQASYSGIFNAGKTIPLYFYINEIHGFFCTVSFCQYRR